MSTNKYAKLDALIVGEIKSGNSSFGDIWTRAVAAEASAVSPSRYVSRTIDARLQTLRKRGLIRYSKGRWEIAE